VDGTDDRQPTTHSWSVTLSQRMPGDVLWETSYVGNKSKNLTLRNDYRDINLPPLGSMLANPGGDANQFRPRPQYRALTVESHRAFSRYNALQTMVSKQTGLVNLTGAYTWSKAMGIRDQPVDALVLDNNYGPLAFDRTHNFAASYVLTVPDLVRAGGNGFARQVANGWQVSGIVQWTSGINLQAFNDQTRNFNMNYTIPGTTRSIGGPDIVGTTAIRAQPIITCDPRENLSEGQYMNGACFAPPIPGSNGQPGVNGSLIFPYMSGPAFFNTDLSLFKNFHITESKRIQFRASAYNFLNHPVRSFIGGDQNLNLSFNEQGQLTNNRFGFADYTVGKRIVHFGVKFEF
jgi:hypothetical protein